MKKTIILGLLILTCGLSATFAQGDNCVHHVWVEDKDPKGTNIRDTPSIKGKIIDVIPKATDEDEPEVSIEVVSYSNGWLKMRWTETVNGNEKTKFGWISAKKVDFAIENKSGKRSVPLYSSASRKSKKIASVPDTAKFDIVGLSCFGFKISYQGKTGWIWEGDTCGNPLTTCS
jgi:uncharacterized protein YbbC (DUF1343 family)